MEINKTENKLEIEVADIKEYGEVAKEVLDWLGPEIRVLLLTGGLGAGKTTFSQALCAYLGVKEEVTSPTYSIVNEYHTLPEENGCIIWIYTA